MMKTAALLLTAALLAGCAAMRSVSSDVSSFGEWPAERKPGTYAFERLPSQQARPAESEALEAAAAQALAKAGFQQAAAGQTPDVLVQVGASDARVVNSPWHDPLWWRGGFGYHRYGPWMSPRWGLGMHWDSVRYERQVGVLIRDRASGKPLYEARASSEGNSPAQGAVLSAMFQAALMDFPRLGINPRRVVVEMASAARP
jgi:predicted small secreted protein